MAGRLERFATMLAGQLGLTRRPGEPDPLFSRRENLWIGLGLLVVFTLVVVGLLLNKPIGWIVEASGFAVLIGLNVAMRRVRRSRTVLPPS